MSLLERIADSDDERRRSIAMVHRAIEHQNETIAGLRRAQRIGFLLITGLLLLVTAAAVAFGYQQLEQQRSRLQAQLDSRIEELRTAIPGSPDTGAQPREAARAPVTAAAQAPSKPTRSDRAAPRTDDKAASEAAPTAGIAQTADGADTAAEASGEQTADAPGAQSTGAPRRAAQDTGAGPASKGAQPPGADRIETKSPATGQVSPALLASAAGPRPAAGETPKQPAIAPEPRPGSAPSDERARSEGAPNADRAEPEPRADAATGQEGDSARIAQAQTEAAALDRPIAATRRSATATAQEQRPEAQPTRGEGLPAASGRAFAVQLIGFYRRADLDAFVAAHSLPKRVYLREERFRDRPWYVLIHSLHPDRESARAAADDLPADLADLDVWIRPMPADAELETLRNPAAADTDGNG